MGPWTTTFSMPQSTSNPPAPTQTYWTANSGGWAQKSGFRQALQLNLMHTQPLIFGRFFKMFYFYFWLCWVFIAECGLSLVAPFEVCPLWEKTLGPRTILFQRDALSSGSSSVIKAWRPKDGWCLPSHTGRGRAGPPGCLGRSPPWYTGFAFSGLSCFRTWDLGRAGFSSCGTWAQ